MERNEFLEKLEKVVKTEELVKCNYVYKTEEKTCYCILGHAYKIVGKEQLLNEIAQNENNTIYELLSYESISEETGLTIAELGQLQNTNDYGDKDELLDVIKELKETN